jgi:hypothetical protein
MCPLGRSARLPLPDGGVNFTIVVSGYCISGFAVDPNKNDSFDVINPFCLLHSIPRDLWFPMRCQQCLDVCLSSLHNSAFESTARKIIAGIPHSGFGNADEREKNCDKR